ncbi:hypothetical protein AGMMS4952_10300 [Spirochaetia bacterium]|nr:hypothetical protein AGMMS4952_10300 [Spirochaetia bacterium]
MTDTVKVSVIIPVYNAALYLRQCLNSIINQTVREIEIICVNDGSADDSFTVLQEYASHDERIIILSQDNKGAGAARNAGLCIAVRIVFISVVRQLPGIIFLESHLLMMPA